MNLQNGKFYKTNNNTVVKAQMEADGYFHCYSPTGEELSEKINADGHVEGWAPVGAAEFQKERKAAKSKPTSKKKSKKN